MDLFLTVDVEFWPEGFATHGPGVDDAFRRHVLGETTRGAYGLPFQLRMLSDHGLTAHFLVEALSAHAMGSAYLAETIALIREHHQPMGLHLHPEWAVAGDSPLAPGPRIWHLKDYSPVLQARLIARGRALLENAGAPPPLSFRAGNYGAGPDTLTALAANGFQVDSSHHGLHLGKACALETPLPCRHPCRMGPLVEAPVSLFSDWPGHWRPAQLTACSFRELVAMMDKAAAADWQGFVVVSHGFELLDRKKTRPQMPVVRRFERLCRHLAERSASLPTRSLDDLAGKVGATSRQVAAIASHPGRTLARGVEQLLCRLT